MNIHEYQAKEIFRHFKLPTLGGLIAQTVDEAVEAAKSLGGDCWVVKAQIHAGGRGKGGGVKVARSLDEVHRHAKSILGMTLVTHQTGPQGKLVRKLFIEPGCDILKEYYVAALIDRSAQRVALIASSEGGMDIEEVAEKTPELIHKVIVDPGLGLAEFQARELALAVGFKGPSFQRATQVFMRLYQTFVETDCSIAEINPLVETTDGKVIVLDAKLNFDPNALYRHLDIREYRDLSEEDPYEVEASQHGLAFIKLDGEIGCLVNGAGLAMSTMDIIQMCGGQPANFLDVGGGADKQTVTEAFKLILKDSNVKGILVNIFGGIMKCDVIAEGIITATKELGLSVPLVVRLEGTNVELGKKILTESQLHIIPADSIDDAARKVVAAVKEV